MVPMVGLEPARASTAQRMRGYCVGNPAKGATFLVEQALFCRRGRLYEKWTANHKPRAGIVPV